MFRGGLSQFVNQVSAAVLEKARTVPFARDPQPPAVDVKAWTIHLGDQWDHGGAKFRSGANLSPAFETDVPLVDNETGAIFTMRDALRTLPGFELAEVTELVKWSDFLIVIPNNPPVPSVLSVEAVTLVDPDGVPQAVIIDDVSQTTPYAILTVLREVGQAAYTTISDNASCLLAGGDSGACQVLYPTTFSPTSIAGMMTWGKADSLSLNDGDLVSALTDSSAGGNSYVASGAQRPTYKTNVANGQPGLLFNATTNRLFCSSLPAKGTAPFSFFVIAMSAGPYSLRAMYMLGLPSAVNKAFVCQENSGIIEYATLETYTLQSGTTQQTETPQVILCRWDGTTFYSYVSGVATAVPSAVGSAHNLVDAGLTIGATSVGDRPWNGHILEWGMYDSCISTDDVASLEAYAIAKYMPAYDYATQVSGAGTLEACIAIVDNLDYTGTTGSIAEGEAFCNAVPW